MIKKYNLHFEKENSRVSRTFLRDEEDIRKSMKNMKGHEHWKHQNDRDIEKKELQDIVFDLRRAKINLPRI